MPAGFPPIGTAGGRRAADVAKVLATAFSCFVLIVAQSAATSRSFAAKHGDRVDVNRDILGLSGANLAAGLSGTFVVNGSPTKTQILDRAGGRTQVSNLTMAAVVLVFTVFATGLLTNMPEATLAGIVFMIGVSLIDLPGLRKIRRERFSEFVVACLTGFVVFAVGVEQGIVLAVVASVVEILRRAYRPRDFVIQRDLAGDPQYLPATPGTQSAPGLIVFRFDAQLFYANASRFCDDLKALVEGAPEPVRWVLIDAAPLDDVDYSAGSPAQGPRRLPRLARGIRVGLVRADDALMSALRTYEVVGDGSPMQRIPDDGGWTGGVQGRPGGRALSRQREDLIDPLGQCCGVGAGTARSAGRLSGLATGAVSGVRTARGVRPAGRPRMPSPTVPGLEPSTVRDRHPLAVP